MIAYPKFALTEAVLGDTITTGFVPGGRSLDSRWVARSIRVPGHLTSQRRFTPMPACRSAAAQAARAGRDRQQPEAGAEQNICLLQRTPDPPAFVGHVDCFRVGYAISRLLSTVFCPPLPLLSHREYPLL